jgi:hypothetical protein
MICVQALAGTFVAMIGSGMLVQALPYNGGFGAKQLAWMLHAGVLGAVIAPICLLGGPLITRAAWYTAGVVGGEFCVKCVTDVCSMLHSLL